MAVVGTQTGNYETGGQSALAQALGWVYPSHGWYPPDQYFAGGRYLSPVADFVGVPTSGPYALSVAFTDLSNVGAP